MRLTTGPGQRTAVNRPDPSWSSPNQVLHSSGQPLAGNSSSVGMRGPRNRHLLWKPGCFWDAINVLICPRVTSGIGAGGDGCRSSKSRLMFRSCESPRGRPRDHHVEFQNVYTQFTDSRMPRACSPVARHSTPVGNRDRASGHRNHRTTPKTTISSDPHLPSGATPSPNTSLPALRLAQPPVGFIDTMAYCPSVRRAR